MTEKRFPSKIIPPHFEHIFPRKSLFIQLEEKSCVPLVWVNGPPGAGKTVFVVSLLERRQVDFLWYRMDRGENTSADIFFFLNLAAQRNDPRKRNKLPVFTAEYADDIETFTRIFFRELFAGLKDKTAIVFDNCQELEQDASFFSILQIAVGELPQGMQIFCVSRNTPAPVLNRMRLTKELLEIASDDLLFSDSDSQAFLQWLNPALDAQTAHVLHSQSRGWAAGMVLLAEKLALEDTEQAAPEFTGNDFLFDYLAAEILARLQSEVREFLLKSALFTQLTADMGKQLTGCLKAKQFLDDLVAKNCLIERSAESQPVYTYYPLFQAFLLNQAETVFIETEWQTLQTQAAAILIEQNRVMDALPLYQQMQDWPAMKKILLLQADSLIKAGRYRAVKKWISALPSDYLEEDAWLNYWNAEATKAVEPSFAVALLEKCYGQFIQDHDVTGIYSAWQAAVESICIGLDDFSGLETWLKRFDDLRKNYPSCPSLELKVKFYATAVHALTLYNPEHLWLKSLVRIAERLFRLIPVKLLPAMIYAQLGHYYVLTGQFAKFEKLVPLIQSCIEDSTRPAMPKILCAFLLAMQNQYHAHREEIPKYLHKALELSEQ